MNCFLCQHCLPEWKDALDPFRKIVHFKKGQTLFREGDPVTDIYFLHSGVVKVHQSWGKNRELILRFAGNGDVVGHRGQCNATFPVTATALQPGSACCVSTSFLETLLKTDPSFLYAMMQLFAAELEEARQRMKDLALMPARGRLANLLLHLGEKHTDLRLTRQDIASYTGTTYETVFRLLAQWSEEGAIRTTGKHIRILDAERLRSLVMQASAL